MMLFLSVIFFMIAGIATLKGINVLLEIIETFSNGS